MKTVIFILYYAHIVVTIGFLAALIWNTLTGHFGKALLDSVLLLINIMVTAMANEYEEPRQQMFNFIDKYLK